MKRLLLLTATAFTLASCGGGGDNAAKATTQTSSETETVKPATKEWTEVYSIKGSGTKNSAPFRLDGGETKVEYECAEGLFSFYILEKGVDLMSEGGLPEVMTEEKEKSETFVNKEAGDYYISVNAMGKWNIKVFEKK